MPPLRQRGVRKPKDTKKAVLRLLKYTSSFKFLWPLTIISILLAAGCEVYGTYMLKPVVNNCIIPLIGSENPDLQPLILSLIKMAAVYIVGVVSIYTNNRLFLFIATGTLKKIRLQLFHKMQKLPLDFFDGKTHGELMSHFTNDTDTLREMFSLAIPQLLSTVFTVSGIFIMMICLNWVLALVMVVSMAGTLKIAAMVGKKSASYFKENQKNIGNLNGFIQEQITGLPIVKLFNHEQENKTRFETFNENLRKSGTMALTFSSILGPMMNNLSHLQYCLVAVSGAALVIHGFIDIGTIASFLHSVRAFSRPISQVSQQFNAILNALAGAERIFSVIDSTDEVDEGTVEDFDAEKIEFKNVSFRYRPEKRQVLNNINIVAEKGKKIALVGSTGSGKTTITNLLTRFYDIKPGNGEILIDGIPINKIKKDALRKNIGIVLQDTHLFSGTIQENIRFGNLEATDEEIIEAAKLSNADNFITRLKNGYETVLSNDGESLSQGQRQLLSIARTAVANPKILILDEATSSIDTRTELLIEKGMDKLMEGRTTFVIAHRLSTVRNSDLILVMENGEIIERGTHDELLTFKGKYYQLVNGIAELD